MQKQTKKGRISSYLNRFFSNFWVQLILSVEKRVSISCACSPAPAISSAVKIITMRFISDRL